MSAHTHEHDHEGTFAAGQASADQHPERAPHGDFADGQRQDTTRRHEGEFAAGQATTARHPESGPRGRYA